MTNKEVFRGMFQDSPSHTFSKNSLICFLGIPTYDFQKQSDMLSRHSSHRVFSTSFLILSLDSLGCALQEYPLILFINPPLYSFRNTHIHPLRSVRISCYAVEEFSDVFCRTPSPPTSLFFLGNFSYAFQESPGCSLGILQISPVILKNMLFVFQFLSRSSQFQNFSRIFLASFQEF